MAHTVNEPQAGSQHFTDECTDPADIDGAYVVNCLQHRWDAVETDQVGLYCICGALQLDHSLCDPGVRDRKRSDCEVDYPSTRSLNAVISSSMGSAMRWMLVQ